MAAEYCRVKKKNLYLADLKNSVSRKMRLKFK